MPYARSIHCIPLLVVISVCFLIAIPKSHAFASTPTPPTTTTIRVTAPKSTREWKEMISVLVDAFNDTAINTTSQQSSWLEQIRQKLARQEQEANLYRRYTKMARSMLGKKYALLIAKQQHKDENTKQQRQQEVVVGMAEVGMYVSKDEKQYSLQATVGVLAVLPSHQGQGIGHALLEQCETLVGGDAWNQQAKLYLAVEPNNTNAMRFFQNQGYQPPDSDNDDSTSSSMVMIPVSGQRGGSRRESTTQPRPHVLLCKRLEKRTNNG